MRAVTDQGVLDDVSDWGLNLLELKDLKDRLSQLPMLAVLLPSQSDNQASEIFERLSEKGLSVEVAAHTSYLHQPRTVWVLDWKERTAKTPATHLTNFVNILSEETQHLRPHYGPWLWPLHDSSICSAISLSEIVDPTAKCWRKLLWALRVMPPENGSILEKCIMEHYGTETSYVFDWANLFTRGLWIMSLPMLIFGAASVKPSDFGVDSLAWYILQGLTILWGLGMACFGCSRQAVLRTGSGLKTNMVAGPERIHPVIPHVSAPNAGREDTHNLQAQTLSLPGMIAPHDESDPTAPVGDTYKKQKDQGKEKDKAKAHLSMRKPKMPERKGKLGSKEWAAVLEHSADGTEDATDDVKDFNLNPEYIPSDSSVKRYLWGTLVTASSLILFLSFATLVLSLVLQLKSYLIFEWGECIRLRCDNAGEKWGFTAVLVDIAVDILLALVFIVGLGEACKAMSFQLARVWNFRLMRTRHTVQSLISLCVEVMAKVGVFVILGFVFLPSWSEDSIHGSQLLPEEACSGRIDYDLCKVIGCDGSDPYCCSGTLSCARQLLPFSARRGLFENWLTGPFMVGPFVDLIPAVLAPILADKLADLADEGASSRCGRCCCLSCGWLARFLAFIFVLDGGVTGIRYVCLGKTFRETTCSAALTCSKKTDEVKDQEEIEEEVENVDGALEQVTLREFDAMDEIKELKLNFIFVLLFAPLKPLLVLPTLLARLIEVRAKLQKVFLIRRRNVPRDAKLVHGPQEFFTVFAVIVACFWHFGLAFMAYNNELPSWNFGSILGICFGGGTALAVVVFLIYREADRRAWALLVV